VVGKLSKRKGFAAALCWLPVAGLVAALFVAPSSTGAASDPRLNVSPRLTYGGEMVTFSGDMGVAGVQRIRLQRRGFIGAAWADVHDPRTGTVFRTKTKGDGTFSFEFPSFAMNAVYVRVVNGSGRGTPSHLFSIVEQDVDVLLGEVRPADVPLPRGFAVVNEPFQLLGDTARIRDGKATKRVLKGRTVELQQRNEAGDWKFVDDGTVAADNGMVTFPQWTSTQTTAEPEVYRIMLDEWVSGGDRVGWFPSLPFYLEVVQRPHPVGNLRATATTSSVTLHWTLPQDPNRDKIVIARVPGSTGEPNASIRWQVLATIDGSLTTYTDRTVYAGRGYTYSVYTRSRDGVYSRLSPNVGLVTPAAGAEG